MKDVYIKPRKIIGYQNLEKGWACYFFFQGFSSIQLGFHICLKSPNIEIHIPFGFFRIGKIVRWCVI